MATAARENAFSDSGSSPPPTSAVGDTKKTHRAQTKQSPRAVTKTAMQEQARAEIKAAYQKTEKYNLEFGKVCCEWRDKFRARGFRKNGDGVVPILEQLNIAVSTAYFWMNKYELSIGLKPAKPPKPTPEAPSGWTRENEKRANRSDPISGMKAYKILADKMLEAGYKALLAKKTADRSHLWAAKDWAKLRLDLGGVL